MQNQQHQLIQQEILYKLNAKAIAFYGLPTLKDIIEDYVINLPQNFQYTVLNEENINFWTNDVMCILSELDMQAADDAIMYEQCYAGNDTEPDAILNDQY